ncbi:aldo/keto reductase, partial [Klebsiella pneumoniae]|nr:aldo/keto reductase [Klebsiella pneumoniae]
HLRDNAAAADIMLSPEDILTIDHIFAAENVAGLRYNQGDFNLIDK